MFVELPFVDKKMLVNVNHIVSVNPTRDNLRTTIVLVSVEDGINDTWTIEEPYGVVKALIEMVTTVVSNLNE